MAQPAQISRTSIYVAAGRAVGAREPDPSARNPDYLAEKLLGDPSKLELDHPAVRALSRTYDDAMRDVEVDRPATQELKKQRVTEAIGTPPSNLTYVTVDFQHDKVLDVLTRHGYDPTQRTFFILEGVTMYLPEEAARDTLRFVGAHPPGSGIVFDFVYRAMIDMIAKIDMANIPDAQKPFVQRFLDLTKNEPWIFGLPVGGEREFLREFGLDVREMFTVGGEDSAKRYLTRADGTQVGAQAIAEAMARMAARAREVANASPEVQQQMSPERMREQQRLSAYHLAEAVVAG